MTTRDFIGVLRRVFGQWPYVLVAAAMALIFFLIETWLANFGVIRFVFGSPVLHWSDRISVLIDSVPLFIQSLPPSSQLLAISTAILIGIDSGLVLYYIKRRAQVEGAAGSSFIGIVISLLGAGCASCGSVLLSSLVGFTISIKIISLLPLRGKEFGLIGIGVLLFSIYTVAHKIAAPQTCAVRRSN